MKKLIVCLLFGALVLASCNSKSEKETKSDDTETAAKKGGTIQMTKADFLAKIYDYEKNPQTWTYQGDKPAIIDFYADWCPPCRQIAPVLEELSGEYADDIYIYKVNVDNEQELAAMFGIQSIPTMLYIPMQGAPQSYAGAAPKSEMENNIKTILLGS